MTESTAGLNARVSSLEQKMNDWEKRELSTKIAVHELKIASLESAAVRREDELRLLRDDLTRRTGVSQSWKNLIGIYIIGFTAVASLLFAVINYLTGGA